MVFAGTGVHNGENGSGLKGKIPDELIGKKVEDMTPKEAATYQLTMTAAMFGIYGLVYFISINQFMGNFKNTVLVF